MLGGMEMMLKSMGLDPQEMKASIENFKQLATTVAATQKRVDETLTRIESKLDELLSRGEEVQGKEEMAQHFVLAGVEVALKSGEVFETESRTIRKATPEELEVR